MTAAMVATAIAVPAPAQAGPVRPLCFASEKASLSDQQFNEKLNVEVGQMRHEGKSDADIKKAMARYGLVKVSGDRPAIEPLSVKGDVYLPAPEIWRDTCSGRYSVFAYFNWKNRQWEWDIDFSDYGTIGADDVFGVALSRNVAAYSGWSFTRWDYHGSYTLASYAEDANTAGVAYAEPDKAIWRGTSNGGWDYDFYRGQVVYSIQSPGCGALQAVAVMSHNWRSVSLNGVGVGPWSISVSWSPSSNGWKATSGASNTVYPC